MLAITSQHCRMLHFESGRLHTLLHVAVGVFAQSLNPVKLLATCKRPNNVGSCCVRLHVACPFVGLIVFILNTRTDAQSNQKKAYSYMFCRLCPLIHDRV